MYCDNKQIYKMSSSGCCSLTGGPPKDIAVRNAAIKNLCATNATICGELTFRGGSIGEQGIQGVIGPQGLTIVGPQGEIGSIGQDGIQGVIGPMGLIGPDGPVGPSAGALGYAMFYGLTAGTGNGGPTDYGATVAAKTLAGTGRVPFPRDGPLSVITRIDSSSFTLPAIGTYLITFKVHTTEPGQLQLELDGADLPETIAPNMNPTSGGHLLVGNAYITTSVPNSVLAVINPSGNTPALTITPADGSSTHANAQSITIQRIV